MPARQGVVQKSHGETERICLFPPCQVKCPIHEQIQRTNVLLSLLPHDPETAAAKIIEIGDALFRENPFFTVCGYVCGICELECSYAEHGGAIKRRLLKRFVAESYVERLSTIEPLPRGERARIAIIGGGPAGLMAAYELAGRGYRPVIFESSDTLGGALRLIPHYRLPQPMLDAAIASLLRVAGIEVCYGSRLGDHGFDLDRFRNDGFAAIFIAVGSPTPRILEYQGQPVPGQQHPGVIYGHSFLYELAHNALPDGYLCGRTAIVVGGGNVAFDAARSARRLGGITRVVCLESGSGAGKDHLPADPHEVSAAIEEGVEIVYSRGVAAINTDGANFSSISAPRCTAVFDEHGFNPVFDSSDSIDIPGDLLIIAVGQGPERRFLHHEGLLDDRGKVAVDPLTLHSLRQPGVFLGGDMLRIGFMVDAMADGIEAAESINRFVQGADLGQGREAPYVSAEPPVRRDYRHAPESRSLPPDQRLNFHLFEKGFSLEEAIAEARRCLTCGPCASCEACIAAGIRTDIDTCQVDEARCSGCGICVTACPFGAVAIERLGDRLISVTDRQLCRGCGLCVAACPVSARRLVPKTETKAVASQ
ncbi:FAD-dependent oxidoreductase [Geobacter pelophilus]|uniref:dihydrouracil dehydrogenase (NAD(+)) n=1 Tax=Geoanaerobacter pelophilus TaxID=60036 RepID=A0AAW4LBD5_9BACT|nr:FAD-dependent oxidoreductase [Geoanaerobacter pelophilus]MBT0665334.1 FAD-dependent oxidoreductase [Geoanaerobacter pelophilus]